MSKKSAVIRMSKKIKIAPDNDNRCCYCYRVDIIPVCRNIHTHTHTHEYVALAPPQKQMIAVVEFRVPFFSSGSNQRTRAMHAQNTVNGFRLFSVCRSFVSFPKPTKCNGSFHPTHRAQSTNIEMKSVVQNNKPIKNARQCCSNIK